MRLRFNPSLEYQRDAIDAVVGIFEGQPRRHGGAAASIKLETGGLFQNELGIGNRLALSDEDFLRNVHRVQEANDIEKVSGLQGRDFSIEMETGTGKTYVYLRTLFELNMVYGFTKFVIVVPSIAIREGVLKSIALIKEHVRSLYDKTPFDYFVFDSARLGRVRQFATSNHLQIMVINIQSFQRDIAEEDVGVMTETELKKVNVINRESDRMSGRRPIEFIQATNPIVVIDEPQSVDTTAGTRQAITNLNPLLTLRYSATHKNPYNLLYKLDPIKAYDLGLVKRIEVASVRSEDDFTKPYVKLVAVKHTRHVSACVEMFVEQGTGPRRAKVWVRQGDNLFVKSGGRDSYRDGYIIKGIDCTPDSEYIEFNQGKVLELAGENDGSADEIARAQVFETVEQHLKKERRLKGKDIKVLSLFFVDRVASYRVYNDDGTTSLGKVGRWFEEAYRELTAKPFYKGVIPFEVHEVHGGYFSQDRKGRAKDTSGRSAVDEGTYRLIMKDKERLLDPDIPLRFIFSHTALREGWDSPNVFQICTLNETRSKDKKRQEIGRGLRLPVIGKGEKCGERAQDEAMHGLTVIANESYEEFARKLQAEFEEDVGIRFGAMEKIAFARLLRKAEGGEDIPIGQEESAKIWNALVGEGYLNAAGLILPKFDPKNAHFKLTLPEEYADLTDAIVDQMKRKVLRNRIPNARERRQLVFRKEVQLSEEFQGLWERIKHRTRYRLEFATEDLIKRSLERIKNIPKIEAPGVATDIVGVDVSEKGVSANRIIASRQWGGGEFRVFPDVLSFLQRETQLTRHTIFGILKQSGRIAEFEANPQAFMSVFAKEISRALHDLVLEGIRYEKVEGAHWEQTRFEEEAAEGLVRYLNNLYEVQNKDKSLFDAVEFESEVEKRFARDLDSNEHVKLFFKLPSWFRIDTPVGAYNPDWAFVTEREERLYFVRETKSTHDADERRVQENQKVACGKKHFDALGVDYAVVTSLGEVGL